MHLSVERWHAVFRQTGGGAAPLSGRLQRLRRRSIEVCAEMLTESMAVDETVYVIRKVHEGIVLNLARTPDDEALARRWGGALARRIGRAALSGMGDEEVALFEDEEAYRCAFLHAYLRGQDVAQDWRFRPLANCLQATRHATIAAALRPAQVRLPHLMRRLQEEKLAEAVLAELGPERSAELWARNAEATTAAAEGERPLFAAALAIARALGWLGHDRGPMEGLFHEYVAAYPRPSTWTTRVTLADGVVRALRFLRRRLSPPSNGTMGEAEPTSVAVLASLAATFDWLDLERVQASMLDDEANPSVMPFAPCPRTEVIRAILHETGGPPDAGTPGTSAHRLWLMGAVLARRPEWREDAALPALIEAVLAELAPAPSNGRSLAPEASVSAGNVRCLIASPCAAAALLWRAVCDLRLPALCRRLGYPWRDDVDVMAPLRSLLVELGRHWFALARDEIEAGLIALAGFKQGYDAQVQEKCWDAVSDDAHREFQAALVRVALAHRLLDGEKPLQCVTTASGPTWAGQGHVRVLGEIQEGVSVPEREQAVTARWQALWHECTGLTAGCKVGRGEGDFEAANLAELTTGLCADLVLRAWARWLPHFDRSSSGYLLEQLIRRDGWIGTGAGEWIVELASKPLDVVLHLASYLDPLDDVPWLLPARVRYSVRGG